MRAPRKDHIYTGDCLELMRSWPDASVDHCIADPPFGIASGRGRRTRRGLSWAFSSHVTMQEAWDQFGEDEYFRFTLDWLREVCRVVRPNGNILVFGTFHNIYLLGFVLGHLLDRRILNSIVWFKPNAQPNITARTLTESTEHIIWAVNESPKRAKNWIFNYDHAKELNGHRQMRNFWNGGSFPLLVAPVAPSSERRLGSHPAQKPRQLIDRMVHLFTNKDDLILDPFAGSGVVGLSARAARRRFVLIEESRDYSKLAEARLAEQRTLSEIAVVRKVGAKNMTLSDIELSILQKTPVPQADDLDKVFEVARLVSEGFTTARAIAEELKISPRQGEYYAEAAVALRLIGVQKDILAEGADDFYLTDFARDYFKASPERQAAKRRFAVRNAPIIKYVAAQLGITQNGELPPYPVPPELLDEPKVEPVLKDFKLAGRTPQRRAKTITAWLRSI